MAASGTSCRLINGCIRTAATIGLRLEFTLRLIPVHRHAYTQADLRQTSIGDRACGADHDRYMRNSDRVHGPLPP
jgi:hypothetical protein